jgi:succinate dehydrogenase/fumarate reductase-like Fe-S protein
MFPIPTIYPLDELYIYKDAVVDTSKLIVTVETISQEILIIKEKIESYEADLQTAKQKGDKEEVKLLMNLLIELQKEKNLLISNANSQGYLYQTSFSNTSLSLSY